MLCTADYYKFKDKHWDQAVSVTSFPCYIEFYVDMDPEMEGLEELVAPNGRHNQFKCSMCDIFCIVRNMLPPQYLFKIIYPLYFLNLLQL